MEQPGTARQSTRAGALAIGDESLGNPLSIEDRKRVLSAGRLKLSLTIFVTLLLLGLSAMIFTGVTRIFDWLTPSIQRDLEHKVARGVVELSQTTQLGMLLGDKTAIAGASADYLRDADVVGLFVLDANGKAILEHGKTTGSLSALFSRPRGKAHDLGPVYAAWDLSTVESVEAGRVGLFVSKERLEAGMQLRKEILTAAGVGGLLAFLLSLGFVNFYIGPILRVTSEAFVRLEATTEAALSAARLKSQFLANMSHEIRTPMNGIIGVLDLLNRTALSAKQQRYAQTIETSARGLLTIIDDILDFSKLEAGKYVLHPDDFEVRQMSQEVVELLAPRAHSKGVELVHRVAPEVPFSIHGDVDRIRQVLTNLIGNAIKFTETGHVELRITKETGPAGEPAIRFAVRDTGVGISQEDRAKLFGVFSQVDGSLTRKQGGTGLGLAICKRLVEAMNGVIDVDTELGKGSTFWFSIPLVEGNLEPPADGMHARDARVLVVSRDEAQSEMICELIARWGMGHAVARDAGQACSLIMDSDPRPFDVAVVDGFFDEADPSSRTLFDLCTAEGLPLVRLLSTVQSTDRISQDGQRICLTKPVRVSELYNGLISLLDGVTMTAGGKGANDGEDFSTRPQDLTILIVDDNEINRLVAVDMLDEFGYRSEVACDGAEAVEKASRGGFAAILMDCQMPVMDGYEATRRIRELPGALGRVPIIALTAHAMVGDRDRVIQAGMDDYTSKPVRARALERVLKRWTQVGAAETAEDEASSPASSQAPRESASPESQPFGPHVLDPEIPRSPRVIAAFLRTTPEAMSVLSAAIKARDAEEVRKLAHKLKGGCLSVGANQLAAAAFRIERAAAGGKVDAATARSLDGLYRDVKAALETAESPLTTATEGDATDAAQS